MNSFNREQYLKQLRMYYSGDRNDTEQFLEEMSDSLDCYLKEHPSATTVEIAVADFATFSGEDRQ